MTISQLALVKTFQAQGVMHTHFPGLVQHSEALVTVRLPSWVQRCRVDYNPSGRKWCPIAEQHEVRCNPSGTWESSDTVGSYLGAVEPLQAWVVHERLGTALLELGPHRVVHFMAAHHEC